MGSLPHIKYLIIYLILLFVETKLLFLISIKNVTPDLILIFVLAVSFKKKKSSSSIIGFFAGFGQDIFSTKFLGLSALTKTITGFLGVFFQQQKRKYKFFYYLVIAFFLILLHESLYQIIYSLGSGIKIFSLFIKAIVPRVLYTEAAAILYYFIFNPSLDKKKSINYVE